MPLVAGTGLRLTAKAGTTVVGTEVTGWTDQVTGTRTLNKFSTFDGPQITEQLNTVDVLSFNNSNALQLADGLNQREPSSGNTTISYFVIKSAFNSPGFLVDGATGTERVAIRLNNNEIQGVSAGRTSFVAAAPANEWIVGTVIHARSPAVRKIYINGELLHEGGEGTTSTTGITLGARSDGFGPGLFTIAEIVEYYDVTEHTQSEVDQNVAYFESEWGLSLLPNYVSGPFTKDGVLQAGVIVQVTAYDDYTMATGKQDVGNYVTDVDGVISIPSADVPAGKKLLLTPHNEDTGTLSSAQGKFVSDVF